MKEPSIGSNPTRGGGERGQGSIERLEARLRRDSVAARRRPPAYLRARIRAALPERPRRLDRGRLPLPSLARWALVPIAAAVLVAALLRFPGTPEGRLPGEETAGQTGARSLSAGSELLRGLLVATRSAEPLLGRLADETLQGEVRGLAAEGSRAARTYTSLLPYPMRRVLGD